MPHFVLATIGTDGDVYPYLGMGTTLRGRGHRFLTSSDTDVSDERLKDLATFATGIAPEKPVIARHPDLVARAHALNLTVTSWTFRADDKTAYPSVRDEMAQFLYTFGIDALFTNNPDQFPRR